MMNNEDIANELCQWCHENGMEHIAMSDCIKIINKVEVYF